MLKYIIGKLANHIMNSREPDFKIGPVGDPYMIRWWWIPRNRFFNVYIHHILHDDDDWALHDHPWSSLSLLLDGEIVEYYKHDYEPDVPAKRILKSGQWVYRSEFFAHRLTLQSKTATTVFITGRVVRKWGFHCPEGWVYWKDFVDKTDTGSVGRGCGEIDD